MDAMSATTAAAGVGALGVLVLVGFCVALYFYVRRH